MGVSIVWLAANPAATLVFCFWDHRVCPPAADALGAAGLGWSNPACEQFFLPSLNQATQQTTAHPSENDKGRPLARKAPQATPKKQRVKRGQDYLTQLKELDIPESAKAARTKLVATLQDKKITCGKTFVDRVRDVCIWEKTRSKSADVPKRGGRGAELPPDVSRQFLRKSHIYLSKLVTVGTSAKKQTINTSCLVGLLPKTKTAIKQFLNFQDDDLKELAESGSVRAFSALNKQFPENLETFKDFIGLFGEGENSISRKHVSRFTSMHAGKGTEGLAPRAHGVLGLVARARVGRMILLPSVGC